MLVNAISNWNNETPAQKAAFGSTHRILYDTGADATLMTPALLRKLGEDPHRKTNVSHTMMTAAVGLPHKTLVLHDVRFCLPHPLYGIFHSQ